MRKGILVIAVLAAVILCLCACGTKPSAQVDTQDVHGTWQLCGFVLEEETLSRENMLDPAEYKENYGLDFPEEEITVDADGIQQLAGVSDTEGDKLEKTSKSSYDWNVRVTVLDQKPLKEPLLITYHLLLKDGFLFLTADYSDKAVSFGDAHVYEKVG